MIVKWTSEAEQDRIDIWDYIVVNNPVAAVDLDLHFSEVARSLATQSEMGVAGQIMGTRELYPHHHYRML